MEKTDKFIFFKCKDCEANIALGEGENNCSKCGEKEIKLIYANNKMIKVCAHCGEILLNKDMNDYRGETSARQNTNTSTLSNSVASGIFFLIMLVILIGYSVVTYFFWNCFNLIIFIILLFITILALNNFSKAADEYNKEQRNIKYF